MDDLAILVFILIFLELFEGFWQRSGTMLGYLLNGYHYYRKSIFFYLLMHPTYYYILFIVLLTNIFNGWIITILTLKTIDIFFKITLMQNIFIKGELDASIGQYLTQKVSPWLFLLGTALYVPLLISAIA